MSWNKLDTTFLYELLLHNKHLLKQDDITEITNILNNSNTSFSKNKLSYSVNNNSTLEVSVQSQKSSLEYNRDLYSQI